MHSAYQLGAGVFDPRLQLEAEDAEPDPLRSSEQGIHAEILAAIAAIDRLSARWQCPAEEPCSSPQSRGY